MSGEQPLPTCRTGNLNPPIKNHRDSRQRLAAKISFKLNSITPLMEKFMSSIMAAVATVCFVHQSFAQGVSDAPLSLFINGAGSVSLLQDGQPLEVGQSYTMTAIPGSGSAFSSWQPVNVFTFMEFTYDSNGDPNPPMVSTVLSLVPSYTYQPALEFTMQPVTVIYDLPGIRSITQSNGWQVNFVPVSEPSCLALMLYGFTLPMFHWGRRLWTV
jgi:hypothetical protein